MNNDAPKRLVRLTVNLRPRVYKALTEAMEESGDSITETVSRALILNHFLLNKDVWVRGGDGALERVELL